MTDPQLGPIQACLLAHQLSNTLALLFFADVSRDRLLYFDSYRTSYDTRTEAVRDFRELRTREVPRIYLPGSWVNSGRKMSLSDRAGGSVMNPTDENLRRFLARYGEALAVGDLKSISETV